MASVHGGVRPRVEQGSNVTYNVAPRAARAPLSQRLDFRMGMPRTSMPSSSKHTTFRDDHGADCRIRMRATNPFLRLMNSFAHEPFVAIRRLRILH